MNSLLELLPPNMHDTERACICAAFDRGFALLWQSIETVRILADLDNASENALDVMAHDLAIPDYGIKLSKAIKLELIKENVYRNKFVKGTAETVKRAVSILYKGGEVREWQDTGADPYTFGVCAVYPNVDDAPDLLGFASKVRKTVEYTKNARSHLESIGLYLPLNSPIHVGAHTATAQYVTIRPYMPPPVKLQTKATSGAWTKVGQRLQVLPYGTM